MLSKDRARKNTLLKHLRRCESNIDNQTILAVESNIDEQTVLAVESLFESQSVNAEEAETVVPEDEDDVFQCGKCKKSFNSLSLFMSHKKTCSVSVSQAITIASADLSNNVVASTCSTSQNQQVTIPTHTAIQFPGSPMSHGLVLSESDYLSLNLEPQPGLSTHFLPQQTTTPVNVVNPATVSIDPSGSLSVNSNNDKVSTFVVKQPLQAINSQKYGDGETERSSDSTVNIITEFHSSMVKQNRRSNSDKVSSSSGGEESVSRKYKLKCAYCNKAFAKNFDLQQHIRSHTGEKPFQCIVCGRAFAQKSNVKKHMQTHKVWPDGLSKTLPKNPLEAKTSETNEIIPSSSEVVIEGEDGKKSTKTNVAGISLNATYDTAGNVQIFVDNSYVCPYCNFSDKAYYNLKSHMKIHKTEKVYKCTMKECGETYLELDPFLQHIKTHENEMQYCCHLCHKSFPTLKDLGYHQYSHSLYPNQGPRPGPRYYRCVKCMNKYATASALEHHMATTSHRYPCPHCNKVFTCERYLRRHLLVHGTVMMHRCEVCSKCFKTEHYLKMHSLIHTGEKPFQCLICNKSFNRKDKLKRHDLIHIPFKRFKCPFKNHTGCMKEFNRPDKLKAHILTHNGMKPFKCKKCHRHFSRRSHLRDHERYHNNDYRFRCEKCNKAFLRERRLKEHKCVGDTSKQPAAKRTTQTTELFDASENNMEEQTTVKRKRGRPRKSTPDSAGNSDETSEKTVENPLDVNFTESDFQNLGNGSCNERLIETPSSCDEDAISANTDYLVAKEISMIDDASQKMSSLQTDNSAVGASNDNLHLEYDETQSGPIIIQQNKSLSTDGDSFQHVPSSVVTLIENGKQYSQQHFTIASLKNDLKSSDDVQLQYNTLEQLSQVNCDNSQQPQELELTYVESDQDFVQFQDGGNEKGNSLQLTFDSTNGQHFTVISTDENGQVSHVGPVILQVQALPNS
ncbi:Zinc finger protein 341 [Nymphon striatum]|nr:Zinc finger protein 341 [Nymphon striatum]